MKCPSKKYPSMKKMTHLVFYEKEQPLDFYGRRKFNIL